VEGLLSGASNLARSQGSFAGSIRSLSTLVFVLHNFGLVGIQGFWYVQFTFLADVAILFIFLAIQLIFGNFQDYATSCSDSTSALA
jgi:hypothetical protein